MKKKLTNIKDDIYYSVGKPEGFLEIVESIFMVVILTLFAVSMFLICLHIFDLLLREGNKVIDIIINNFYLIVLIFLSMSGLREIIRMFLINNMKFAIDSNGLLVKYAFCKWTLYTWGEFEEISIALYRIGHLYDRDQDSCVFFVRQGCKKRKRRAEKLRFYKKVFSLQYSNKLLEQLQKVCPYEISDIRDSLELV